MGGVTPVGSFKLPNYNTDTGTAYPLAIDADFEVCQRIVDTFAPRPSYSPDMYVFIDPGWLLIGTALTEIGNYITGDVAAGSKTISNVSDMSGIATGYGMWGYGISSGSTISSLGTNSIVMNNNASQDQTSDYLIVGQITPQFTAPVSNPRIDRIVGDLYTGLISVVAGTESATPSAPDIPTGKFPIAQVTLQTSSTYIDQSMIRDERAGIFGLGAGGGGFGAETTVAASGTVDLGAIGSHNALISGGSGPITSLGNSASISAPLYLTRFAGAVTLTNSSTLIIPGGSSYTTSAGDIFMWEFMGSSTWRVAGYSLVSGNTIASGPVNPAGFGTAVNGGMTVSSASTSGTYTADYLVVATALNGVFYALSSYSKLINLSGTGAGGMDTGSAPASGYVALYAIYNPTTATASILACNVTTSSGSIYSGSNMPSGYTASALIGIWRTNGSRQFVAGQVSGRTFFGAPVAFSVTGAYSGSLSIATAVPPTAKSWMGYYRSDTGVLNLIVSADGTIGSYTLAAASGDYLAIPPVPITSSQNTYAVVASATSGHIYVNGYTF